MFYEIVFLQIIFLPFFTSTLARQMQCYLPDVSLSNISANLSTACACSNNSDCINCEDAVNSAITLRGNRELKFISVCVDEECILQTMTQVDLDILLPIQCPCSLYEPPSCRNDSLSCSSLCATPDSIRFDCDESDGNEVVEECITRDECTFDPFDERFCRNSTHSRVCTSFCDLGRSVSQSCRRRFSSSCRSYLETLITAEFTDVKFIARQLALYSNDIELDDSVDAISELVSSLDNLEIDEEYYEYFENVGNSMDRILDDDYTQWNVKSNKSAGRVLSSIEGINRRIGNDLHNRRTNASMVEYIGRNSIFNATRQRVCRNQSYFEFIPGGTMLNSSVLQQAYVRIPFQSLCTDLCCTITVSLSVANNIGEYVTRYLVGDNTSAVSSTLLSVNLYGANSKNQLKNFPIDIIFPSQTSLMERGLVSCKFWNNATMSWSVEGVQTEVLSDGRVKCIADHLTSFAILVSPTGAVDSLALSVVSYIGCSISIVALSLTLAIFIIMRKKLGKGILLPVHFNFCLSLLLGLLIFVAGIETAVAHPILCTIVAAAIQYFFLCSFCWMLSEGIMLYFLIVRVFSSIQKRWYILIFLSWGIPVPIVAFSAGFLHSDYGTPSYCWINANPAKAAIWTFVGPIILIILINSVVLVITVAAIVRGKKIGGAEANVKKWELARSALKGSIVLLPLLGVTWLFGVFAVSQNTIFFAWLFTILNSLQGLCIFILHVARNEAFLNLLGNLCKRCKRQVSKTTLTNVDMQGTSRHLSGGVDGSKFETLSKEA